MFMADVFVELHRTNTNHGSVLKEYYARYLTDIRKNSQSTVKHYFDALNNISRRLKEKSLVRENIYEVADIDTLFQFRDILYSDPDFLQANERGRRMYSAGLNNYCRFASGEGFSEIAEKIKTFDVPVSKDQNLTITKTIWKRSGVLRMQAFELANYKCELNDEHKTFIAESTHKPYMEGHHALPMSLQDQFPVSLDVYSNIICLCPLCHRKIHYGVENEKKFMLDIIYAKRSLRLARSGIKMSQDEFVHFANHTF